ncbi:sensor histidine kinase [Undibacterium parvum]|uniref:Histidine kinase n=1 Tax=Undibacterium parvum TaxID=401471 RepID=A0A3S9HQA2_9BURK|nr:histidine kinase [Undibacterium parvum]AZP14249.1 histidine kinase [Undibacterium parvum]
MNKPANTHATHLILPDYCNLGILFRVLFIVNASVFIALLGRGQGWVINGQEFIETSMLVELICLSSLLSLCSLRPWLASLGVPAWVQRSIAGCVPAGICWLVLMYLESMDWFAFSFPRLRASYAVALCFIYGIGLQHYFELRNRAFSPALGEAKLQALQARIRPHFLFNSLNAVLSLIRTDPRRAETVLEDLADLFRVLMRDTRDMTTLKDEIHLCEQYLSIEKLRLGERLQVSWHTENLSDTELGEIKIAALLLQPLLENAVHHGVEPSAKTSLILVAIRRNLNKIEISVSNPLHADARLSQGNHMALDNIRQRLLLLYDIEADLSYGSSGNNFEVKLQFPAKK